MIKLGEKVRDLVTGFEGIVVARCEYLYGSARLGVVSLELKDGLPRDSFWEEERRFEVVEVAKADSIG